MGRTKRYKQQEEKFFFPTDEIIEEWTPNPRRSKRVKVQLPFGEYEDLRVRTALIRPENYGKYAEDYIHSPDDVAKFLRGMPDLPQESVVSLLLDARNAVIGIHEVHIGSTRSSVVSLANLFQAAIVGNASAVIIVHNHPSGNPEASRQDKVLAQKAHEAGQLLGIDLLDFCVITSAGITSCIHE